MKSNQLCFTKDQKLVPSAVKGTPPFPPGEFDVIYADPPWQYEINGPEDNRQGLVGQPCKTMKHCEGSPERVYHTMRLEEICNLQVPSTKDSVLFLWTTASQLESGLAVLKAWGFVYKTCEIWDKMGLGLGYYTRVNHEILLWGLKGKIGVPPPKSRRCSIFRQQRTRHSKKPNYYYKLIEGCYPNKKYLELFARNQRAGWTSWGNEIYMDWVHGNTTKD